MNNILTINKHRFVLNGTWGSVSSSSEVPDAVKNMHERFYTVLNSELGLTYLGKYTLEKKPAGKIYSLASALYDVINQFIGSVGAETHDGSDFLFMTEVGGQIYVAGYRDRALDITTDKIIDEIDAQDFVTDYISRYGMKHLYYSGSLSIADDVLISNTHQIPDRFFKSINKSHLIKDSKKAQSSKEVILAGLIGVGGLAFLVWLFSDEIFSNKVVQQATNTGASPEEIKAFKQQYIKNKLAMLYADPYPSDMINQCALRKNHINKTHGYWHRQNLNCGVNKTSFDFARDGFGIQPSEFKATFSERYQGFDVDFSDALPPLATASVPEAFDERSFIPESTDELNPQPYAVFLDVLTSFNDTGRVIGNKKPEYIKVSPQYIGEENSTEVTFSQSELWKQGSFTLQSTNLSLILSANQKLDSDYLFLTSISSKGKNYEAKYTYISL